MVKYPGLLEYVKTNLIRGKSIDSLYDEAVSKFGYENDYPAFYRYVHKVKRTHLSDKSIPLKRERNKSQEFIEYLKKHKVVDGNTACKMLECEPKKVFEFINHFRSQGYEIICNDSDIILSSHITSDGENVRKPLERKRIKFGVASDLHFGSKHAQISHLLEFCEICRKKGVEIIFVPGDICAGYRVYKGQEFEVYAVSAEEQEESIIMNLPKGFEWYVLGGNHDYSFVKSNGHNPLLTIESIRDDFHYLGFDEADVPILPGVDLRMWHPSGGVPYALSYRIQKKIEQIAFEELSKAARSTNSKPSIRFLLCGHLHVQMQAMFGSIFGAQCGAFEGQTSYLKRKGLYPHMGGYIIDADLAQDGLLRSFQAKFYIFPEEVDEDWKNYDHKLNREKLTKPLFE